MNKEQIFYPVIIPTLNRYDHLRRCIESLSRNTGAEETELVIGLDYPPSEKYMDGFLKIKEYLPTIIGFKKVTIIEAEKNLGEGGNVRNLRKYIEEAGYDGCIFSEDDCEFASNFLEYQNWGLNTFRNDQSIYAICSLTTVDTSVLENNVYKVNDFYNSWGYGTWNDRIEKYNRYRNGYDKKGVLARYGWKTLFNKDLANAHRLISMFSIGAFWSDLMLLLIPEEERWCIFPKENLVRNFGCDNSGVHGGNPELYNFFSKIEYSKDSKFVPSIKCDLYNPIVAARIQKKYFPEGKTRISAMIKFVLYKLTGYSIIKEKKGKWLSVKLQKVL